MWLLAVFSFLWASPSCAMFMGYEVKQIPIERLEANLQKALKNSKRAQEKIRYKVNLGRLYGMAYYSGSSTGPVKEYWGEGILREEPEFDVWLKNPQDLENSGILFPQDMAKKPVSSARSEHLNKAIKTFQEVLGEGSDYIARLGLGWALLEAGRKEEARKALAPLFEDNKDNSLQSKMDEIMDALPPTAVANLRINSDTRRLVITLGGKEFLNKPMIPFAIAERARRAKSLPLEAEANAYEANPSRENLEKILAKIQNSLPTNSEIDFKGDIMTGPTRDSVIQEFRGAHRVFEGKAGFSDEVKLALSATEPEQCAKLAGSTSLKFSEGDFPLDLVCAARLAWIKKNWGICREYLKDNVMPKQKLPACIGYLAYRSGKEALCQEVRAFEKENNHERNGTCETFAQRKNEVSKAPGPNFYDLKDWKPSEMKESEGWVSLVIQSKPKSAEIESIDISFPSSFYFNRDLSELELKARREIGEISHMSNPKGKTIPVSVSSRDAKNNILEEEAGKFPSPITEESLGKAPKDFKMEDALRKISLAEAGIYYLRTLDQKKDGAEVERVRQKVWMELSYHNSRAHAVTPLAVGARPGMSGADMLDSKREVPFDLLATRFPQKWNWINSSAAWLVYRSPTDERPIDGTHLFGQSTFWLFWDHGFQPLCALDNTGDSILRGEELNNLFLWRDSNSNGREDAGELTSMGANSVEAIDCRHERGPGGLWQSQKGFLLKSGKALPIVDLILQQR